MPPLQGYPSRDTAAVDGYAFRARDLVGASSYSPLPLSAPPVWVEAGDAIPVACDCVLDSDFVDLSGPMPQVLAEAIPGQGVRRAGSDIAAGSRVARQAGAFCRAISCSRAPPESRGSIVRRPRLRLVNVPGGSVTADLIAESARTAGAEVISVTAAGRDAARSPPHSMRRCDLLLMVGGSGVGRTDAAVTALGTRRGSSPTALPCSPAAPRLSGALEIRRWSCCPARRIRLSRHGGRWRFRRSIACPAGGRGGR